MTEKGLIRDASQRLANFEKRSWALKVFEGERWGNKIPCPLRLTTNTYFSCEHKCAYCYVWTNKKETSIRPGFRKSLQHDINRAGTLGINSYVVELSASTDPFQPSEAKYGESLFAITELLKAGFKVLIITKNPGLLLTDGYEHLLNDKNLFIDVSIASLYEGTKKGGLLNNNGPSSTKKIASVKEITGKGKEVRVRIDPIIPTLNTFKGQDEQELKELVKILSGSGVNLIISKTMRLSMGMPKPIIENYLPFYKKNGTLVGSTYILNPEIRKKMLSPIYDACRQNGIKFCPCCDFDVFNRENVSSCRVNGETHIMQRQLLQD